MHLGSVNSDRSYAGIRAMSVSNFTVMGLLSETLLFFESNTVNLFINATIEIQEVYKKMKLHKNF